MAIGVFVLAGLTALPAHAAFPGRNGKIAFVTGGSSVYVPGNTIEVMNPDGTGRAPLTSGSEPAWSPDGRRIAFLRSGGIWVAQADGSGATQIFTGGFLDHPTWSPDGEQIAFIRYGDCYPTSGDCDPNELLIVNADGTNLHQVLFARNPNGWPPFGAAVIEPQWSPDGARFVAGDDIQYGDLPRAFIADVDGSDFRYLTPGYEGDTSSFTPSWSPDGSRIALTRIRYCCGTATVQTLSIRPDGSNPIQLWAGSVPYPPAWAPDGSRVLLSVCTGPSPCENDLVLVDPNGSNPVQLTDDAAYQGQPDWQPLSINAYPRPRAATPTEVPLVPAYNACTTPNRTHGPPLAYDSCSPPVKVSDEATLGTTDANGRPSKGQGLVRFHAVAGNVQITFESSDVYDHSTLTDYTGELRLRTALRITDKRNTPHPGGPGAATVSDTTLGATVPCTATADTTVGASCVLNTTANALAPGSVTFGARSIWELGQVQVDDGGSDGDADTAADNTLFLRQGLFVP